MSTLKHEYCTVDVNVQKERSKRITVPSMSLLGCTFVSTLFSSIFYWSGLEYCIVHFGNNPPPGPAGTQESSSCWASAYMNRSSEVIHLTASSIMRETGTVQDSNNTVATRTKPERTHRIGQMWSMRKAQVERGRFFTVSHFVWLNRAWSLFRVCLHTCYTTH